MTAAAIGLVLGVLVGAGCRYFDIPLPAPERLIGVGVLFAITLGFVAADRVLPKGETLVRLDGR
jgi:XapX domain-containing protein